MPSSPLPNKCDSSDVYSDESAKESSVSNHSVEEERREDTDVEQRRMSGNEEKGESKNYSSGKEDIEASPESQATNTEDYVDCRRTRRGKGGFWREKAAGQGRGAG